MIKSAEISKDKRYRYTLRRCWDINKLDVMFIMLNPSTADHEQDDPTIRKCMAYAKKWGYGGLYVCNLFAYRTHDPERLKWSGNAFGKEYIIGPRNEQAIMETNMLVDDIVCAWGGNGYIFGRDKEVQDMFNGGVLKCIEKSIHGNPKHPLYLPGNLKPIPYA